MLFIINSQDFLFNGLMQTLLICLFLIALLVLFKKPELIQKYEKYDLGGKRDKLKNYLFSNGTLRIYMLAYLNLTLFSSLNISEMKWISGLPPVNASNVISILVFTSTIIVPPGILVFFWWKRNDWDSDELKAKVGTFLEGTRHDKDHQITFMIMQSTFFLRRFILAITLVYWQKFVWGQLAL